MSPVACGGRHAPSVLSADCCALRRAGRGRPPALSQKRRACLHHRSAARLDHHYRQARRAVAGAARQSRDDLSRHPHRSQIARCAGTRCRRQGGQDRRHQDGGQAGARAPRWHRRRRALSRHRVLRRAAVAAQPVAPRPHRAVQARPRHLGAGVDRDAARHECARDRGAVQRCSTASRSARNNPRNQPPAARVDSEETGTGKAVP